MSTRTPLRITARGVALRDELLLLSLTRASVEAGRGERDWEWCDDGADVVFVGADEAATTQNAFPMQVPLLPPAVLDRGQSYILRMPIRPAAFITLLEKVQRRKLFGPAANQTGERPAISGAERLAARMTGEQRAVPPAPIPMSIDHLIERVRRGGGAFEIRGGPSSMIIAPAIRHAWMADPNVSVALPTRFTLHELPGESANMPEHAMAMDLFLWRAAMEQQEAVAARVWSQQNRFALRRWPDFGRFGRDPLAVKLTSLLARSQPDLGMLQRVAGDRKDRVVAFLNALALLDLLATGVVTTIPAPIAAARSPVVKQVQAKAAGGVFSRIRSALGLG